MIKITISLQPELHVLFSLDPPAPDRASNVIKVLLPQVIGWTRQKKLENTQTQLAKIKLKRKAN